MEKVIILEVPNKVDYEFGPNWGNIKQEETWIYQIKQNTYGQITENQ